MMSLIVQESDAERGFSMEPSSTRVGKHSLNVAVSVGDFCHVYIRQASSVRQVCTCDFADLSNLPHFLFGFRREPQE